MKKILVGLLCVGMLIGCGPTRNKVEAQKVIIENKIEYENSNYVSYVDLTDIKTDIEVVNKKLKGHFTKYIQYVAPNGKPINIVASDKVSDEQVLKAYNVLSFYLTSHKSYDMDKVANELADTGAILMMPNGADGQSSVKQSILYGQPLYQNETPVTGDVWYINNNYEHRDASYEEILHMVHDNGIGTSANKGVQPELQKIIQNAQENALPKSKSDWGQKGLWGYGSKDWLVELSKEGSLEQEYIVSVLDSYYGLWSAFDGNGGMWGIYTAKDRQEVQDKDPMGLKALESFLPEYFTYMDRLSPDFEGTFELTLNKELPYTYKSQYINNIRLTGEKNTNVNANNRDNIIIGNKGNNTIDGKEGIDVVQFTGASTEYEISNYKVKDTLGRDGTDTLKNIEILRFTDKDVQLN